MWFIDLKAPEKGVNTYFDWGHIGINGYLSDFHCACMNQH